MPALEDIRDALGPALGQNTASIAADYYRWVNDRLPFMSAAGHDRGTALRVLGVTVVGLGHAVEREGETVFAIDGGWLAKGGELAFAIDEDQQASMVLRGFRPRLPGWLYRATQLYLHRKVAAGFARTRALAKRKP